MMDYQHHPQQSRSPPQKKAKTKFPKIFQCTGYGDCKMTFTRSEHLARHIRKHTGERPFRCHCNRTFSRLDNLRQHIQTVHANEQHILNAPPPPPLPHSNKVAVQHEYPPHPQQQQYWQQPPHHHPQQQQQQQQQLGGQVIQQTVHKNQNVIIEHNPSPTNSSGLQDAPPQFRPKHRPNPLSLQENGYNNGHHPPHRHSPQSPMFNMNSPSQQYYQQHGQQPGQPPQPWLRSGQYSSHEQLPSLRQQYQYGPSTPGNNNNNNNANEYYYNRQQQTYSSPQLENSYNRSTISSTSSKHLSNASSITTPVSSTTKTNSWLSNVLCQQQQEEEDEDRPHTWGPTSNRFSTPGYEDQTASGDRNSLSQLVRITEDAHISTPPSSSTPTNEGTGGNNKLPSLSTLFDGPQRPPQLTSNRSYSKNLVLPRPDSYPPKDYTLPIADTRPPTLPPAGQPQYQSNKSSSGRMNKPLPPLPVEAQERQQEQQQQQQQGQSGGDQKDGMDALIKAAGV